MPFQQNKTTHGGTGQKKKKVKIDRILLNPAIDITKTFFSMRFCLVINDKIFCLTPQSVFVCLYFFGRLKYNMWASCIGHGEYSGLVGPLAANFLGVESTCMARPPAELLNHMSMCWPSWSERTLGQLLGPSISRGD